MNSDILNARDCGATPGFRYHEADRVALQRAADETRCAGGRTIFVPTGVCEFVGATVEISTAANAAGTVRTYSRTSPFVLTDAQNNSPSGEVLLEVLAFQGAFQAAA
jgi:hypothetical protein